MDTTGPNLESLARLLRAEQLARQLPTASVVARFALGGRFQSRRREYYAGLAEASKIAEATVAKATGAARTAQTRAAGAVLLVCEARPFEPNLYNILDQMLLRLLTEIEGRGFTGWVARAAALRGRCVRRLLGQLPAKPVAIVAVGVSQPQCLEELARLAPVVQVGMRSLLTRERIPCVEHDSRWEAAAIGMSAGRHRNEQISFIAAMHPSGGKRKIEAGDMAVLSGLATEAQNRHIAVPGHLTFWVEPDQDLQATGILPKILRSLASRTLVVVSGPALARQVVAAMAGMAGGAGASQVICRHWSATDAGVPVIGPNLDQLARVALMRVLGEDRLPAEATVLVRPVWHQLA